MADRDLEGRFWNSTPVVQLFAEDGASSSLIAMLDRLPPSLGPALDIGCGGGRNAEELYRRGYNLSACDAHSAMVEQTAARLGMLPGVQVRQAEMARLPYPDESFELVVASGVFHNAYSRVELQTAVAQAARVLAPGGSMYVNVFVLGDTPLSEQLITVLDPGQDLFLTLDDLRMTLLAPAAMRSLFTSVGLTEHDGHVYGKQEFTGQRDIYQAWLTKS
jgi:SAM-dependent methyltransferase